MPGRLHHLNCISSCPLGGRLMDGRTPSVLSRGSLCCHCLLMETPQGLVLVDTGFGLRDVANPRSRLSGFFLALLSPDFREEMTAVRQVKALGYRASDVRHIVLTHLDFDHAGGLDDFPEARVHLLAREHESAFRQSTCSTASATARSNGPATAAGSCMAAAAASAGWASRTCAPARVCRRMWPWCPCPATRMAMPAWPCRPRAAGGCWPATPTSTTARCIPSAPGARRACASTRR
jgi:hypothetical protein